MKPCICFNVEFEDGEEWESISLRDPDDSDHILSIENHHLSAQDVVFFLQECGIIQLTDKL